MLSFFHCGKQVLKTKEMLPIVFAGKRSMSGALIGQKRMMVK
jgi:hypothetical protein